MIFRPVVTKRKNRLTPDDILACPSIEGMLEISEEEDEKEEDEEEESSDDDEINAIKDDFIDWPIDCRVEVLKSKKNALSSKNNTVQWSGQDVLTDFDPDNYTRALYTLSLTRIWPKGPYGWWKQF